jgi:hypothetical protein
MVAQWATERTAPADWAGTLARRLQHPMYQQNEKPKPISNNIFSMNNLF